jgi:gas vesicle protein
MADDRDGGFFHTLGAMVVGMLIGGAVALLMAPKPGSELREELKQTASTAEGKIKEVSQQVADKVKDKWEEVSAECCKKEAEDPAPESSEPEGV